MSSKKEENVKEEEEKNVSKESKKKIKDESILKTSFKYIILFCFIVFALLSLSIYLGVNVVKYKKESEKDQSLYISKIEFKNLGQLVTQTADVTVVKKYKDSREFLKLFDIPFTEYVLIFSQKASVDAYIDFEKVHHTVDNEKKKIYVEIPHAQNKAPVLDEKSLKTWYDNKNIFNSVAFYKSNELRIEIKNKAEQEALKGGLLEKAEKNAEMIISNMFKTNASYKDYTVEFNYIGG